MNFKYRFYPNYKTRPYSMWRTDIKDKHCRLEKAEHIAFMEKCLKNNIMPHDDDYKIEKSLIKSAKRLLTNDEFKKLVKLKRK